MGMWINLQRLHSRWRVVQTSILIGICIYIAISFRALNYKVSLGETNGKSTEESLILLEVFTKAVQEILNETPYLWRRLDISNDTSRSRIESQREWIARFSRTNFSHFLKRKTILVQNNLWSIYCTQGGRMNCPYSSPPFQEACSIREETYGDVFSNSLKYSRVDAYVSKSTWIPQPYEWRLPSPDVLSVKYVLEPPHITKNVHLGRNARNTLLASYWRGSDIPIPYGLWIPGEALEDESYYEPIDCESGTTRRTFQGAGTGHNKSRLVAAVISNCKDANGRLEYIRELQRFIPVDVYGKCGALRCPKKDDGDNANCMGGIERTTKFYLAFENSNCEDYITEKFFSNGLKYDLVPVVMGAPKQNYLDLGLPPTSFIHVDDFESPKELADFLIHLNGNDKEYLSYLRGRRGQGGGQVSESPLSDFFCRLCGLLYYADYVPPPVWKDSDTWESTNKCSKNFKRSWKDIY